jgi:hypothetical protein
MYVKISPIESLANHECAAFPVDVFPLQPQYLGNAKGAE